MPDAAITFSTDCGPVDPGPNIAVAAFGSFDGVPDVTKANASETAFDGVLDVTSPIMFVGGTEGVACCG